VSANSENLRHKFHNLTSSGAATGSQSQGGFPPLNEDNGHLRYTSIKLRTNHACGTRTRTDFNGVQGLHEPLQLCIRSPCQAVQARLHVLRNFNRNTCLETERTLKQSKYWQSSNVCRTNPIFIGLNGRCSIGCRAFWAQPTQWTASWS
jgi:hypothetical protein